MPNLHLFFLRKDPQALGTETLHYERIKALLAIGNSGQVLQDCIVDTGSILPVFPERQWKRFESDISWLYIPGDPIQLPDWLAKTTGLGDKSIECRIGKVRIRIKEIPSGITTPPIEIVGKFALDNGVYSQILLGLGGQAFSRWKLILDYVSQRTWLEY